MAITNEILGLVSDIHDSLRARGETLSTAESLTAGGLSNALTIVPGVGKKTAERLMVELKSRLHLDGLSSGESVDSVQSSAADVRDALTALGYGTEEIRDTMRLLVSASDSETMLRDALALLGARRAG